MSPLTAVVVVLCVGLAVVGIALGTVIRDVRVLRQQVISLRKLSAVEAKLEDGETRSEVISKLGLREAGGIVLVVDEKCSVCEEVIPIFVDKASKQDTHPAFVVSREQRAPDVPFPNVTFLADRALHHYLNPGYLPALHFITPDGEAALTEPVGSRRGLLEAMALSGIPVRQ